MNSDTTGLYDALKDRLAKAIESIDSLCSDPLFLDDAARLMRLRGKQEGFKIALQYLEEEATCFSRGPRIGNSGVPYCKEKLGHEGPHRANPDDGWSEDIQ